MATYFKPVPSTPNRVVFKIDAAEIHYAKADGSYGVLQTDPAANTLGQAYQTTNSDTSTAITAPVQDVLVVAPTGASQSISFGLMGQTVLVGANSITGGGHLVGTMGWGVNNSSATIPSAYGVEGRFDSQGASSTTTRGHGVLGLVVNNAGTLTTGYGVRTELQGVGGTTPAFYGYSTNCTSATGVTKFVGYGMPALTASPTTKLFLENLDPNAPSFNKSPLVQQDYVLQNGVTTGLTLQVPNLTSNYVMNSAGTLATLTVNLPLGPLDGQEIAISSTFIVTAFTLTASAGGTLFNAPTALTAGQTVKYKYLGTFNVWIRLQ